MKTIESLQGNGRLDVIEHQLRFLVAEAEERRRFADSYSELVGDLSPIASQGMTSLSRGLAEAEARGYVGFARNTGQSAALSAGFQFARGEVIVSMDGDLQNDPRDIPTLLDKIREGHDVVCGWRKDRQDRFLSRRLPSVIANWIIGRITGVRIHDNGCSLKAYRAEVIRRVSLYSEMHRFIPAMSTLAGARIAEIVVRHHARRFGRSKYGISRAWRVCLDIVTIKMITSFAARPGRWFGMLGVPFLLLGPVVLAAAFLAGLRGATEPWLVVSVVGLLLVFLGVHLVSLGIVGELAVSTGDFSPRRTVVPVRQGIDDGQDAVRHA